MEQKTTRRLQLQDVLHAAKEEGLTQSDYREGNGNDGLQARRQPQATELRGKVTTVELQDQIGLPTCFSANEKTFVLRAIATAMRRERGAPPRLQWVLPISCSTQMRKSLEDYQVYAACIHYR